VKDFINASLKKIIAPEIRTGSPGFVCLVLRLGYALLLADVHAVAGLWLIAAARLMQAVAHAMAAFERLLLIALSPVLDLSRTWTKD
jgi:hypothetical protein